MDINNRFLEVYNLLLSSGRIANKGDFAKKLGVSSSIITDITKNRTKPGLTVLRNIVLSFPEINTEWLISGVGEIQKNIKKNAYTPYDYDDIDSISVRENDSTLYHKLPNVSPKEPKNVSPAVSPTHENCPICAEKERIISSMEVTIDALLEANAQLKKRLDPDKSDQRQVG